MPKKSKRVVRSKPAKPNEPTRELYISEMEYPLSEMNQCDLLAALDDEQQSLFAKRDDQQAKGDMGQAWRYNALGDEAGVDMLKVAHNGNLWSLGSRLLDELRELRGVVDCLHEHMIAEKQKSAKRNKSGKKKSR